MTEEEAKLKMCPLTFAAPEIRSPDGTGIQQGGPYHCMGSDCMAWCWDDGQQNSYDKTKPPGDDWEKLGNFWTRTPKPGVPWRPGQTAGRSWAIND